MYSRTVKQVFNALTTLPWDPNIVAIFKRSLFYRGKLYYKISLWDLKRVAVIVKGPFFINFTALFKSICKVKLNAIYVRR